MEKRRERKHSSFGYHACLSRLFWALAGTQALHWLSRIYDHHNTLCIAFLAASVFPSVQISTMPKWYLHTITSLSCPMSQGQTPRGLSQRAQPLRRKVIGAGRFICLSVFKLLPSALSSFSHQSRCLETSFMKKLKLLHSSRTSGAELAGYPSPLHPDRGALARSLLSCSMTHLSVTAQGRWRQKEIPWAAVGKAVHDLFACLDV